MKRKIELSEMNKQEIEKLADRIRNARTKKDLVKIIENMTHFGEKKHVHILKELKFDIRWDTRMMLLDVAKMYILMDLPGGDYRRRRP